MLGKLIILCAVLVAMWAGISRMGKALGIGPFSRAKKKQTQAQTFIYLCWLCGDTV